MNSTLQSAGDLLDSTLAPALLCTSGGRVVHANAPARALLSGKSELSALGVASPALASALERGQMSLPIEARTFHFLAVAIDEQPLLLVTMEPHAGSARRALDALVDHLPVGVMVFDSEGLLVHMNAAHRRFMAIPADVQPVGRVNVLTDPISQSLKRVYQAAYSGAVATVAEERFERTPLAEALQTTTEERYYDLVAFPVLDGADRIETVIAIIVDATERVQNRQRLETERHERERVVAEERRVKGLTVLAGGIAHSFNNLVTRVLSETATGQEAERLSDVGAAFRRIEAAALQMSSLTSQLSAYAGHGPTRAEELHLDETVRQILELRTQLLPPNVGLEIDLDAPTAVLNATARELRETLLALLENAKEALVLDGKITVRTRLERGTNGSRWVLTLRDEGIGMPEELAARAFDPFVSTKGAGRGLGLAAVKGVVERLRGSVSLRSAPGRGTTVEVSLPCRDEPLALPDAPKHAPQRRTQSIPFANLRVLLVDDDDHVRASLSRLLTMCGASVRAVASGESALVEVDRSAFDVVLLDVMMPGMDGWQTLAQLRKEGIQTPVMMVSGYSQDPHSEQAALANAFLAKPFTLDELEEALRNLGVLHPPSTAP